MKNSTETLLLSLALTIGLYGCGKGQQKDPGNTGNTEKNLKMDTEQQHPIDIESLPTGHLPGDTVRIIPYRKGKQWVFVDRNKEMVIPQIYEEAMPFNEHGLAAVKQNGKMGFIDRHGRTVVPIVYEPRYFWNNRFLQGQIGLHREGEIALLDQRGREIVPAGKYDDIQHIGVGLTIVEKGERYGFVDGEGREVVPPEYDYVSYLGEIGGKGVVAAKKGGKFALMDHEGKAITDFVYRHIGLFRGGHAAVQKETWGSGYLDEKGQLAIPCRFAEVKEFYEGRAAVKVDGRWGFIDTLGHTVIECRYDETDILGFEEGLVTVRKGDKWGMIDREGREVLPFRSTFMPLIRLGMISVTADGKEGLVDRKGKEILPLMYDDTRVISRDMIRVVTGEKQGAVDRDNNVLIPLKYLSLADDFTLDGLTYGLISVRTLDSRGNRREGYLTLDGTEYFED